MFKEERCPPSESDGGGGGNRTHVQRTIYNADYVCSFEFSSQSEDYLITSTNKPGDY